MTGDESDAIVISDGEPGGEVVRAGFERDEIVYCSVVAPTSGWSWRTDGRVGIHALGDVWRRQDGRWEWRRSATGRYPWTYGDEADREAAMRQVEGAR